MFERIEEVKTYYPNGALNYEAKNGILRPDSLFNSQYSSRTDNKGVKRVYIEQTKYNPDGTIQWRLLYNDYGEMIECIRGRVLFYHDYIKNQQNKQ